MIVFLKRLGFILLVFLGMAMLMSMASLWALRQGNFYKPSFLENSVDTSAFDYIVLGASTGLTTLNTQVIDSVLSTQGLNLAMDDTGLSSQYLMLQHFIQTGKTTKVCVLAPSISSYDAPSNALSDNDYRFLPYGSRDYVHDYYQSFPGLPAKLLNYSSWIPMLGVGYYNAELFYPSLVSWLKPEKRNRFDAYGNYSYPKRDRESALILNRQMHLVQFQNPYISRIQDLCRTHNIQLILYMSPHEQLVAKPVETSFQVINHSAILENSQYFYDVLHVNGIGRQIVSERFAADLEELVGFDAL